MKEIVITDLATITTVITATIAVNTIETTTANVRMHRIDGGAALAPFGADSKSRADMSFVRKLFELGRTEGQNWLKAHHQDVGVRPSLNIADNV